MLWISVVDGCLLSEVPLFLYIYIIISESCCFFIHNYIYTYLVKLSFLVLLLEANHNFVYQTTGGVHYFTNNNKKYILTDGVQAIKWECILQ